MENLSLILSVAAIAAGTAWFMSDQFRRIRHDTIARIIFLKERIYDLEQWAKSKGYRKQEHKENKED